MPRKPNQPLGDYLATLDTVAYERYLKRHGYRGLAAARMDGKRREARKRLDAVAQAAIDSALGRQAPMSRE